MIQIKRLLALSGLTALLAALAAAAPAHAGVKLACLGQGTAKLNPPIPFTGGTGTYQFGSLIFGCIGVENGTQPFIVDMSFGTTGTYTNIVCGTGKISSSTLGHGSPSFPAGDSDIDFNALAQSLDYTVEFVGGQGILKWTSGAKGPPPIAPKILTSGSGGRPGGYVTVVPDYSKGGVSLNYCTKALQLQAAIYLDTDELID